jgi:hypothetical protein
MRHAADTNVSTPPPTHLQVPVLQPRGDWVEVRKDADGKEGVGGRGRGAGDAAVQVGQGDEGQAAAPVRGVHGWA